MILMQQMRTRHSMALHRKNSMSSKGSPTTLRTTLLLSHPSASGFLPSVQRRKGVKLLLLSRIQILSSQILCLILLKQAASADFSARESHGHSSTNGPSISMTERSLTNKSCQLWSSHSMMPVPKKWGSSPVPILLLASDQSR